MWHTIRCLVFILMLAVQVAAVCLTAGVGLYTVLGQLSVGRQDDPWVQICVVWGVFCALCIGAASYEPLKAWLGVDPFDQNGPTAGGTCIHA